MKTILVVVLLFGVIGLGGCSGESGDEGEHVWKEQTETMDRARQAEEAMKEKAEEQRRAIENIDQ